MSLDPLNNPPQLVKVEKAGASSLEWDNPTLAEMSEAEVEAGPEEEVEEEPAEEVAEPDIEEEVEVAAEEGEEYEVPAKVQEEPPVTPRANKRIQELIQKNKEKDDQLARVLEQLAAAQTKQASFYEQAFSQQEAARRAQQAQADKQAKLQALTQSGFNPQDPAHQFLLSYNEEFEAMRAQQQALQQELENVRLEKAVTAYVNVLDGALQEALRPFDSLDPIQVQSLKQQALALATANQINDPAQAVQMVLAPIAAYLPKKKKAAPKAPMSEETKVALRAGAMKASAAGKPKGTVAGTRKFKTPKEALDVLGDELFGPKRW